MHITPRLFVLVLVGATSLMIAHSVGQASGDPAPPQTTVAKAVAETSAAADPFLWLEEMHGARAMAWVKAENVKTLAVLEHDPHFPSLYADALKIAESNDRIAYPTYLGGDIYNFWQDQSHVRGIWRRTSVQSYATASPTWSTVLDLDAVATAERANWVWGGEQCNLPEERRCLISLSDGGEDAQTVREFDIVARQFVPGGFMLPRGKQDVAWETPDTLLVSREWNPGEVTASGYAYIVKRLARGQSLASATEIFRGSRSDVSVSPFILHDGSGHQLTMIDRGVTFFTSERYLVTAGAPHKIDLPEKLSISGMVAGRVIIQLNEDWAINGRRFPAGSLVSVNADDVITDPEHLKPSLIYTPGERESVSDVTPTKDHLLAVSYLNVRGRGLVFTPTSGGTWTKRQLDLPDNSSISISDSNLHNNLAFVAVDGFLAPTTLYQIDADSGEISQSKALSPKFDSSADVVEQHEATSRDGTQIPYFLVRPRDMRFDGSRPTVIHAYGGFHISMTPSYSAQVGKLWLERGGVYVIANIRGGGEFGPAWHDAGLKTNRQRIYDDFYAVAKDLIGRKITSPRRLGIVGGSNGGLLMGVEFTEHPELWNAVDIQVPLLDMLRYEHIQAGASWVGEYGSVSNPAERAFLASISPYQNIRPGVAYPEPFIWTTTKDDRVGPQHARKFAAKLNAMGVRYLFYEVIEGGHGSGANLKERAHTTALEWTYFTNKLMEP